MNDALYYTLIEPNVLNAKKHPYYTCKKCTISDVKFSVSRIDSTVTPNEFYLPVMFYKNRFDQAWFVWL